MLFSVVAPFLNEEEYLEACVQSLISQDFDSTDYEILFVDNGSTDRSSEMLAKYPEVQVLQEPQKDPYLARNRGVEQAQGEYIVFIDADCAAAPNWLSTLAKVVSEQKVDIVLGDLQYPRPTSRGLRCYEDYYNAKTDYLFKAGLKDCYYGHAGNMVVKRSVFDEVGLFSGMPIVGDTAIFHDLMALRPAAQFAYAADAKVTHLEVTSLRACLHKLADAGRYTEDYEGAHGYRTLTLSEKIAVMRHCIRENKYGPFKSLLLLVVLVRGLRAFEAGR